MRCARWSHGSSTPERPLVRRIILTGNVTFFLYQYKHKTVVILDRVMRVRLNLPAALVLHFELPAVVLVATSWCRMC